MSHNSALNYRADIDGLRAVAVLAVVFYHFGIGGFAGGFVGVDVFFVISGFLITEIIQREIKQGRFTFAGFYERRIRRIFPALFVVLAATLLAGYFILLPSDLVLLGKSTIATLMFGSNIFFWRTSGYFDTTSELNPLLHTWSLGVEEQFYIGLPILLILVYRYARQWLKLILILCVLLSFLVCTWVQLLRPEAAFYLSPFRAWELLIGSLLAVGQLPKIKQPAFREVISGTGFILLLASIYSISERSNFPSWLALGPVLGTFLLIYAGCSGQTKIGSWLSVKPMVFIGMISYSLYLWHWPIVVYAKYINGLAPLGNWAYLGVFLSVLCSIASYYWVETPFRLNKKIFNRLRLFAGTVVTTMLLCATGFFVWQNKGLSKRFSSEVQALDVERNPHIPFLMCDAIGIAANKINSNCVMGDKSKPPSLIVWGDSHALSWAPAFDAILKEKNISGLLAFSSACAPLDGMVNLNSPGCNDRNRIVHNYILKSATLKNVVLVASWTSYSNEPGQYQIENDAGLKGNLKVFAPLLRQTVTSLKRENKKVWLIGPTPGAPSDAPMMMTFAKFRNTSMPAEKLAGEVARQTMEFYKAANSIDGIKLTDPTNWLCNAETCKYANNHYPLYRDGGHLNVRGAMYLKPELLSEFEEFIQ
jgi:peptidoglycan/LPS O-acetylase OafA/YrhL